jgi:hypothetical protein
VNAFDFPVRMPGASLQSDARETALHLRKSRSFRELSIGANSAAMIRDVMTTSVDDGVWPGAHAIGSSRKPATPLDARSSGIEPADVPLRSAVI